MKKTMKKAGLLIMSAGFIFQAAGIHASAHQKLEKHEKYEKHGIAPVYENRVITISHRGASGYAPEHTLPSYQLGKELKGDYIEIDLQMTKDGQLVAMHDETVDRTTNGTGAVKDFTLQQLKNLDAGSWFNKKYPQYAKPGYAGLKVLTLEEIFKEFGRDSNYYIETKSPDVYPGMEEKLLQLLEKYKLTSKNPKTSHVLIQSFSKESLLKVHEMNRKIPLIQLLSYSQPTDITDDELEAIKKYAIGIGPNFSGISKEYVEKTRKHHLFIHPYTVNDEADMKKALEWGVNGVFTNFTDRFNDAIKEFNAEKENDKKEHSQRK
ncbi:glycerophosphodiester phosphodiesterase [Bacillus sp. MUM 13]|uniref:glycerophosphodiester phosphodiesterase n=1 Tax=Bacillus sp. MUM 13 TaxID=1678001 RepID=UPI0008F5A695|nr:glycerophosphodiester phosphodiesterase [Bacillus sp. MUM 13]OIK09794.1 glycerophosphodiester phosphodiesterase [Bacillus sp. MUM 13]